MYTHSEVCTLFDIPETKPAPEWKPYAIRKTKIEMFVNGKRFFVFGGAYECSSCGFGIDIQPPGNSCPRCEAHK